MMQELSAMFFGLLSRLNSLFFRYFAASRPQWPVQFFLFVACKLRRWYDNSCVCCALALSAIEHLYIYAALHTRMMMGARIFLTFFLSVFLWCSAFFSVRITAKEIPVSSDFCLLALFSHSEERRGILTLLDTWSWALYGQGKKRRWNKTSWTTRRDDEHSECNSFGTERTSGSVLKSPCVSQQFFTSTLSSRLARLLSDISYELFSCVLCDTMWF